VRQGEQWVLSELSVLEDVVSFDLLNCRVRLSDIYDKLELPSGDQATAPDATPGGTG
jgi:hypothetical protein